LNLLILGGTKFLGRHLVDAALERNHDVTLFNRGQTNRQLYPELEHLIGDRDGNLAALEGRGFDGVIDTCGYVPRVVRASAELLSETCGLYAFISSLSVYPEGTPAGYDESAPTEALEDPQSEDVTAHYGALKAACEEEVEAAFPNRSLNVRAGLIAGPHDPTGRFTYWVSRIAAGGDVLVPGPPEAPVQFIDARDLAEWTVRMIEAGTPGVFNCTGPAEPLTMAGLCDACADASGRSARARLRWVDPGFLLERGVEPWSELPLWLPGTAFEGMMKANVARATAAGLSFRPLGNTIHDILSWLSELPAPSADAGLATERENALLQEWGAS
jgi:2'-hydroxyisoflavone reductase